MDRPPSRAESAPFLSCVTWQDLQTLMVAVLATATDVPVRCYASRVVQTLGTEHFPSAARTDPRPPAEYSAPVRRNRRAAARRRRTPAGPRGFVSWPGVCTGRR